MDFRNHYIEVFFEVLNFSLDDVYFYVANVPGMLKWSFLAVRHWPKDLENAYYISKQNLPKYLEMGRILLSYFVKYMDMMSMSVKHLPKFIELLWEIAKNISLNTPYAISEFSHHYMKLMFKTFSWIQENIQRIKIVLPNFSLGVGSTALTLRGPNWLNENIEWLYQGIELLFKALADCSTIWMALPTQGLSPDFTGKAVLSLPTLRTLNKPVDWMYQALCWLYGGVLDCDQIWMSGVTQPTLDDKQKMTHEELGNLYQELLDLSSKISQVQKLEVTVPPMESVQQMILKLVPSIPSEHVHEAVGYVSKVAETVSTEIIKPSYELTVVYSFSGYEFASILCIHCWNLASDWLLLTAQLLLGPTWGF